MLRALLDLLDTDYGRSPENGSCRLEPPEPLARSQSDSPLTPDWHNNWGSLCDYQAPAEDWSGFRSDDWGYSSFD